MPRAEGAWASCPRVIAGIGAYGPACFAPAGRLIKGHLGDAVLNGRRLLDGFGAVLSALLWGFLMTACLPALAVVRG
jgi:hypothetical protein